MLYTLHKTYNKCRFCRLPCPTRYYYYSEQWTTFQTILSLFRIYIIFFFLLLHALPLPLSPSYIQILLYACIIYILQWLPESLMNHSVLYVYWTRNKTNGGKKKKWINNEKRISNTMIAAASRVTTYTRYAFNIITWRYSSNSIRFFFLFSFQPAKPNDTSSRLFSPRRAPAITQQPRI